jgi:hypothetical protein
VHLATLLAEAAKDRSADYLCQAKDHPGLAEFAHTVIEASLERKLSHVHDQALGLPQRAVAALFAMGIGARGEIGSGTSGLNAPLTAFFELGAPEELVAATAIAAARTREPITVMIPLIWLAAQESRQRTVCDCTVPSSVQTAEVPVYALDMHTRLGREAISRFAREHPAVRWCLTHYVSERCWRRVAYVAALYVDGAPVARA